MKRYILIFFLFASFHSFAQTEVKISCTQGIYENQSGVLIQWSYSGITSSFKEYRLYRRNNLTADTVRVASISDFPQTQFTDTDPIAGTASRIYIIEAEETDGTIHRDSTSTLFLTNKNTGTDNDEILLTWTSLLPLFGTYHIYEMQKTGTTWSDTLLGTSTSNSFTDSRQLAKCDSIFYRVELVSSSPCNTISNRTAAFIKDDVKPSLPPFDSVSIDVLSQKIVLGWQPSLDDDVVAYLILKSESINGAFLPIDTVWGRTANNYVWENGNINEIHYFKIASIDKCYNTSLVSEAQVNMTLKVSSENCSNTVNLLWNEYINMPSGLANYTLYAKIDNGSYNPVGTIDKSQTQFSYTVAVGTLNVCLFTQAVGLDNTHTASSKVACFNFENPEIAKFIYLRSASVQPNNSEVTLNLYVDASYAADGYDLYRYTDNETPAKVAKIPYTGNNNVSYTDTRISPSKQPYYYYVSVNDACNLTSKSSNPVKTICMHLVNESKSSNKLSWNPYSGWQAVEGYEVYRQEGDDGTPILLAYLPSADTMFVDNQNIASATKQLNYYVVAIESSGNPYGFKDQARSSQASYSQQGEVFIPNAFTPKGTGSNSVFKPVFFFVDKEGYRLQIFNRWGLLLFETTNPDEGWDGTSKGQYMPIGAYIYLLKCKLSSGQEFSKYGTINLLE